MTRDVTVVGRAVVMGITDGDGSTAGNCVDGEIVMGMNLSAPICTTIQVQLALIIPMQREVAMDEDEDGNGNFSRQMKDVLRGAFKIAVHLRVATHWWRVGFQIAIDLTHAGGSASDLPSPAVKIKARNSSHRPNHPMLSIAIRTHESSSRTNQRPVISRRSCFPASTAIIDGRMQSTLQMKPRTYFLRGFQSLLWMVLSINDGREMLSFSQIPIEAESISVEQLVKIKAFPSVVRRMASQSKDEAHLLASSSRPSTTKTTLARSYSRIR
jgi:hypothetical protein